MFSIAVATLSIQILTHNIWQLFMINTRICYIRGNRFCFSAQNQQSLWKKTEQTVCITFTSHILHCRSSSLTTRMVKRVHGENAGPHMRRLTNMYSNWNSTSVWSNRGQLLQGQTGSTLQLYALGHSLGSASVASLPLISRSIYVRTHTSISSQTQTLQYFQPDWKALRMSLAVYFFDVHSLY